MLAVYSPLAFVFLFLLAPPDAGLLPDGTSKVTFRLGLGRVWKQSFIVRTLSPFDSCPYSDTISLSAVICIFVLYLLGSWLVGVVVVYMSFCHLL